MSFQVPTHELTQRMQGFRQLMDKTHPQWELAVVFSKINQYYFTGTMQEGMLLIPRHDEAILWVRRSFERAQDESLFPDIRPMESYRDAARHYGTMPNTIFMEREFVPLAMYDRFKKYFTVNESVGIDALIGTLRAVKSPYELDLMRQSGAIHQRVLEDLVPSILREGMSEVDLAVALYGLLMQEGHQGLVRFAMFDTEMVFGHIAFGESSLYPTSFNGPGGNTGIGPAIPLIGSPSRKLKRGDLIFLDVGCGIQGYHTDKTMTYMFGDAISDEAQSRHRQCVELQNRMASQLKPGSIPSHIYETVMASLMPDFMDNFMGFGNRTVKFLGHGIGLTIDEIPVIAKGFDAPLTEGMVIALEPKRGVPGVGMVGIENTFIVTPHGGECITGNHPGLMLVP
ncbi:Xaa-Pro aminopeptidase [Breznakibacter xylanolyticus]|uniref:Xaa-Pro aminopeptidase n=1 Tax=Breznakibacter xylanolyticus TaxID=990 RepID=A0A2W7MZ06_9BACT|nr:Xaa-Pro peptidase family protein [Breznakibacter xylanolyticus]PZX13050.1 Xaa-Pro aminopeptidase [Breznakibacter xylanolyticus]